MRLYLVLAHALLLQLCAVMMTVSAAEAWIVTGGNSNPTASCAGSFLGGLVGGFVGYNVA